MKIDTNIPMPKVKSNIEIPYEKMKVGDSVLLETVSVNNAYYYKNKGRQKIPNSNWTCRSEKGGIRLWRIA